MARAAVARSGETDRLWSLEFAFAWVVNLFVALVFYLLITMMALYAVERFGASDAVSGLAASIFVLGATVARLFAGNLVDMAGRRRTLLSALAIYLLAALSYHLAGTLGLLLGVRLVHGMAFGIASTAALALAHGLIPGSRRAEGTGYFTLSITLATAIGPLLGLELVRAFGYESLFVASSAASALALMTTLLLRVPRVPVAAEERARLRRFAPSDMLNRDVVPVATFMLVIAIGYSGVVTFLNGYADERGLGSSASTFFVVYAVVVFLSRLVVGRLQDRRGDNIVVHAAIVAFAVGLAVLAGANSDGCLLVAGGFIGLGFGTLMSALQAIAVARVQPHRTGSAIATHFFMIDLGAGLGPVALGALLGRLGYGGIYLVLSSGMMLSGLLYHWVHGGRARDEQRRVALRRDAVEGLEP